MGEHNNAWHATAAHGGERPHGPHCTCRLLAGAVGAATQTLRYEYCLTVLQRRWKIECDHGCLSGGATRATRTLPAHDSADPVQAILIHNM